MPSTSVSPTAHAIATTAVVEAYAMTGAARWAAAIASSTSSRRATGTAPYGLRVYLFSTSNVEPVVIHLPLM